MATADQVNAVIDVIISRITTNITSLGGTVSTPVTEGFEEPTYLVKTGNLPSIWILPHFEGGDEMETSISSPDMKHEFSVLIVGYYGSVSDNLSDLLRTVRGYGYACIELFSGNNQGLGGSGRPAVVRSETRLTPDAWRVADYIVHSWQVKLTVSMWTV